MITRIIGRSLLQSHTLVTIGTLGLVLVTVTVEQADVPWSDLAHSLVLHGLLAVVWLGPLLCGLATILTVTSMKHRGELTALACMGIGPAKLRVAILGAGAIVGAMAFVIGAAVLPEFVAVGGHGWVWTGEGIWHTDARLFVDMSDGGQVLAAMPGELDLQRGEPRLASWASLRWSGSLGEQVEIVSRPARILACIGFSAPGMRAVGWRRPWVSMVVVGVVLLAIEMMGWAMGAQGRVSVFVSGTVAMWVWILAAWPQPSMRRSRPV